MALLDTAGGTFWVRRSPKGVTDLVHLAPDVATPVVLDSVTIPEPIWNPEGRLATVGETVLWAAGEGPALRWAALDGPGTGVAHEGAITDLDSEGTLVVFSEHNSGRVSWTTEARVRAGDAAEATANVEYASGVATDGTTTWVIKRLSALLLRFDSPGSEPVVAASWPGDNTMDLSRGAKDLVWWNHATGELLAMAMTPDASIRTLFEGSAGRWGTVVVGREHLWYAYGEYDAVPQVPVLRRGSLVPGAPETLTTALGADCQPMIAVATDGVQIVHSDCNGDLWRRKSDP